MNPRSCSNGIRTAVGSWARGAIGVALAAMGASTALAQPTLVDENLAVRTAVSGLNLPVSMAFIGSDDFFVLEKASGQVKRVQDGVASVALDLAVNSASERGLLGIALHPRFPANPGVYLYWTESTTGADANDPAATPLLGNRVDRFEWNGATLAFGHNLIRLRALQADAGQPLRGNHNGGVIRFGPDGKLYIVIGDNGRRGQTQNLPFGPVGPGVPDDAFGGPAPDNAHLTGVVLRLNDDGSTPTDNPFFAAGAAVGGEVGANIQKIFAYGIRNSFGMAFDPIGGDLWMQENGDDTFDEINRVRPGMNGGWIQIMGPVSRIAEFKAIELSLPPPGGELQQIRWPAANLADSPADALDRLFVLPGSNYQDPEFSWRYAVAPAGIGFVGSRALGPQYQGDLFVGAARLTLEDGYLFRFGLTGNRRKIAVDGPALADRVADNFEKFDITESEGLLFGSGFGVGTDIQQGPNGNLFVVSLSNGAVYEIHRDRPGRVFLTDLDLPAVADGGAGTLAAEAEAGFTLGLASPMPARGEARVAYTVPRPSSVDLAVFDVSGREVARLASGAHAAGRYQARWDAAGASPGLYLVQLRAEGRSWTERVLLTR